MRMFRYILLFCMLTGLLMAAQNQDTRRLESSGEEAFVVKAVFVDSHGVKWFGTNRGLCRYTGLTWRYYTDSDHLVGNRVNALAFESSGPEPSLWVATTEGISRVIIGPEGITASAGFTEANGLLNNDVSDVAIDSRMVKFFGSAAGITRFQNGAFDDITYDTYSGSMLNQPVRMMDFHNDTLYVAQDGGIGRFISKVDGITGASRWTSEYGITPFSGNIHSVLVSGIDRQFFGTDAGVERHIGYKAKENWDLYSTADGLADENVIAISEDGNGGLWFGTFGGVSHLSGDTWTSYTSSDGLPSDTVYDIAFDLDGSVWFATGAGACQLKDGVIQDVITALPGRVSSLPGFRSWYDPGAGSLHLSYHLEKPAPVTARLYSMTGVLVGEWTGLPSQPGENRIELSLKGGSPGGLTNGIYVLQWIHQNRSETRKLYISH